MPVRQNLRDVAVLTETDDRMGHERSPERPWHARNSNFGETG